MSRPLRWLLAVVLVLVVAGVGALAYISRLTGPAGGPALTLEVKPGDSLGEVAAKLERRGVLRSAQALRAIMRLRGTEGRLRDGLYDLPGNLSAFQVADVLEKPGRPRIVSVTIPEGRRLKDLPPIFAAAGLGSAVSMRAALNDAALSPYARGNLEGFVFPATYPFRPEATPGEIVRALVARMQSEFTPARVASAKRLGLSVRGWVTLASVVQAEAGDDAQMAPIAGVFLNRLDAGMPLGSDPTVAYGLGKALPDLDRSAGDFTKDTPYNTYTRAGLPPGPIDNPGEAALKAVLNPVREVNGKTALYFLHGKNGTLRVNASYAAHLRDVAKYR